MKRKYFYIILCFINLIIPIIDLYNKVETHNTFISSLQNSEKNDNIMFPIYSDFSLWICGINVSKYSAMFFYVLLATIIVFCFIFASEKMKQGLPENINMSKYCLNTYSKVFLLSGFLSAFPLIFNFISMSMFVSSIRPDSVYDIFYGIFSENVFGDIFYKCPLLYLMIFIILVFVFWGIIGCIGYGLAITFKYKSIPLLCEGGVLLIIHYIQYSSKSEKTFSPLSVFCSYKCLYENYKIIFIEIFTLIVLVMLLFFYSSRHNKLVQHDI